MLILWLIQALFGAATLASCIAGSVLVLRRDSRAPLFMVYAGVFGLIFSCSLPTFQFEMIGASLLIIAAGAILMIPHARSLEIGESTATRRRR